MNCRRFQNDLYEYLDGELAPRLRAAVEKHLAECADCRAKLAQEQGFGQSLRDSFRRAAELLELPPSVGRRVLAALAEAHRAAQEERGTVFFWRRLAWPLAVAASVFVLLGAWVGLLRSPRRGDARPQPRVAERVVSVQLSYVVPVYTFRQEGGFVIDALTYQTNVVNERLRTEIARLK